MNPFPRFVVEAGNAVRRATQGPSVLASRREHLAEMALLRDAPWPSAHDMDRLRLERLNATVERASRYSPFYREVLAGRACYFRQLDELAKLPVTSRADIRASGLDRATPASRLHPHKIWRTSGSSSGVPFAFAIDPLYPIRHETQRAFVYLRAGVAPGSRIVEMLPGTRRTESSRISYPTFRRTVLGFRGGGLGDAVRAIQPALLYGNRSNLLDIADQLGSSGHHLHVPIVCSSSETLYSTDAAKLQSFFAGQVLEIYGSVEGGNMAYRWAPDGAWTILEPRILIEVLDERRRPVKPGEVGEIVVTTLTEPTSPLIRYATGDLARVDSGATTGTSGLRLAALEGRSMDSFVDCQGRRVSSFQFTNGRFWASGPVGDHLVRWRIHQSADRTLNVYFERKGGSDPSTVDEAVIRYLHSVLGPLPIRIIDTEQVRKPNVKFRAVTSDAQPDTSDARLD